MEITPEFLKGMKRYVRLLVGQHAATKLPDKDYSCYDFVISSFPPTLTYFRDRNVAAEYHRMGFEETILDSIPQKQQNYELTFIGNFSRGVHDSRATLIESLCKRFPQLAVWAPSIEYLPADSPIRKSYRGQAWGKEMYVILQGSKITLNHHGDILPHANNMRLYEATGSGAMLITDWKEDLKEILVPGREVAAYRSVEECASLIEYYLAHEKERQSIATAGKKRTLSEHTYFQRMKEFVQIVDRYL